MCFVSGFQQRGDWTIDCLNRDNITLRRATRNRCISRILSQLARVDPATMTRDIEESTCDRLLDRLALQFSWSNDTNTYGRVDFVMIL